MIRCSHIPPMVLSAPLFAMVLLAGAAGCANVQYRQVQLGQKPEQYDLLFPADRTRRTEDAVFYLEKDLAGGVDAVVVLLARDRRVAGKLRARHLVRNYGFKQETGYELTGEIDPALADLKAAGPIDSLRAVHAQLTAARGNRETHEPQHWIAAGLVRLLQRWPHAGPPVSDPAHLSETLGKVPGGGEATITVEGDGRYRFAYVQGRRW